MPLGNAFWENFEERHSHLEKNAFIGSAITLGGLAKVLGVMGGAHIAQNVAGSALLRNKRFGKLLGQHFSAGLFNRPVPAAQSALIHAAAGGSVPEAGLMMTHMNEMGSKLREHLVAKGFLNMGQAGAVAIHKALAGDIAGAHAANPRIADAVLEFAKQNELHPVHFSKQMAGMLRDPNHPVLSNLASNLVQLPSKNKIRLEPGRLATGLKEKLTKSLGGAGDAGWEQEGSRMLHGMNEGTRGFFGLGAPKGLESTPDIERELSKIKSSLPVAQKTPVEPGTLETLRGKLPKRLGGSKPEAWEEGLSTMKEAPKGKLLPRLRIDQEVSLPTAHEFLSETKPPRNVEFLSGLMGAGALGAAEPITGLLNVGKYVGSHPIGEKIISKLPGGAERLERLREKSFKQPIRSSFEQGFMSGKTLTPWQRFSSSLFYNPLTSELRHTAGALGAAAGASVPLANRANVLEHTKRFLRGEPGAFQAERPWQEKAMEYAKPALAIGGGAAALGGAGYLAGKKMRRQSEEHQNMTQDQPPVAMPQLGAGPRLRAVPPINTEAAYG